jgi:hypothetical protein
MIRMSVWKLLSVMVTPRPCSGPASQFGHPPLRAGTYFEGPLAASAVNRNTVVTTPSSPTAPSARRAPAPLHVAVLAAISPGGVAVKGTRSVGVAACISSLLRLRNLQVFDAPDSLCLPPLPGGRLPYAGIHWRPSTCRVGDA